jgi:hypothetical protein
MERSLVWSLAAVTLLVLGSGCGGGDDEGQQVPNPAAVFCEEEGGTVSGSEPMCELPDGTVVDAWEHYRAMNPDPDTEG